jgi:GNAT superfamily N-acetyltransferase
MSEHSVNYREYHIADLDQVILMQAADLVESVPTLDHKAALVMAMQHASRCPPSTVIHLAELAGKAIGFARGEIADKVPFTRMEAITRAGYLDQLYVQPAWRSRGVAKKLFNNLCGALWAAGAQSIWGLPRHLGLHRLYARCGAVQLDAMQVTRAAFKAL